MARCPIVLALFIIASAAWAGPSLGPSLGAASNFGQDWRPRVLDAAAAQGIDSLRDEIHWDAVEAGGILRFGTFLTNYPALLAPRGMRMTLIAHDTHPDYDGGVIPHSPAAVAAFARFVAAAVTRFGAIDAVELGNEMNSASFTSGPMQAADLDGKAVYYMALLRAVRAAVETARPGLPVIGGAAHSIPLAWFSALSRVGAPALMDSVAIHPYTTPPEQLRRQIALLRQVPGFETMPVAATEFGTTDAAAAPALLLKNYCQMALSGVTRAVWYPLASRGDGFEPLIGPGGTRTAVGATFRLIQTELAGLPVRDIAVDPFTYGCRFGDRAMVIWGADRAVTLTDPALRAVGATGSPVAAPRLSRDSPLLILSQGPPVQLGETVVLGEQRVIADSFDQFTYPGVAGDPFERFAQVAGQKLPFELGPGQETNGVPWTPYLRNASDGSLRMTAETLVPSLWGEGPVEVVHAFRAKEDMAVRLDAMLAPSPESADGVVLILRKSGATLARQPVRRSSEISAPRIDLAAGDVLEIAVGPGVNSDGDSTRYRFTLRKLDPDP